MSVVVMKEKFFAFFWHGLISVLIAGVASVVVYGIWNPAPLHIATGITKIFLLMIGIDIIIGPLLTFVVYKKGKKTLKFDLAVIVLLQISALLYGMYSVYSSRPVWLVYNVDRFDLVRVNEVVIDDTQTISSKYLVPSYGKPKYATAIIPKDDRDLANEMLFREIGTGVAPSQYPRLYQPIDKAYPLILQRKQELDMLEKYNAPIQVKSAIAKYPTATGYVPLKANAVDMTVLVDKEGRVVKIVDLRPW